MSEQRDFTLQDDVQAAVQAQIDTAVNNLPPGLGGGSPNRLMLSLGPPATIPGDSLQETVLEMGQFQAQGFTNVTTFTYSVDEAGIYLCTVNIAIGVAGDSGHVPKNLNWHTPWNDFSGNVQVHPDYSGQVVNQSLIADVAQGEVVGLALTWHGDASLEVTAASLVIVRLGDVLTV